MRRDWLGLVIRVGFGAAIGLGIGLVVSMIHMGMSASWMMLLIPTVIGAIWGARTDK
jgi:hypothetical protein